MILSKTYLLPTLTYGCEMFASCDAVGRRRLSVTYYAIERYIFGIRRNRSILHFARIIYNVTFNNLMNCRTLLFQHKFVYSRQIPYLYERLIFSRSNRGNTIDSMKYNEAISQKHCFVHYIRLWNQLPPQIQMISNARHFKTVIFKHFT